MDHDSFFRRCTLDIDEGAGMLDLLAILIQKGTNDEEFFVQAETQHAILDELLKGERNRIIIRSDDTFFIDEFEGPIILHDEILEECQRVATLDLLINDCIFILLLPQQSQPMHLLPKDEDRVAKDGVDSIDDAVMDDE